MPAAPLFLRGGSRNRFNRPNNAELNEIGFRYAARIWELRKMGFAIRTIPEGEGAFRFVLEGEPASKKPDTQTRKGRGVAQLTGERVF